MARTSTTVTPIPAARWVERRRRARARTAGGTSWSPGTSALRSARTRRSSDSRSGIDDSSHCDEGPGKEGPNRGRPAAEGVGDPLVGQVEPVAQDDGGTLAL